jgi:hypothetical protein
VGGGGWGEGTAEPKDGTTGGLSAMHGGAVSPQPTSCTTVQHRPQARTWSAQWWGVGEWPRPPATTEVVATRASTCEHSFIHARPTAHNRPCKPTSNPFSTNSRTVVYMALPGCSKPHAYKGQGERRGSVVRHRMTAVPDPRKRRTSPEPMDRRQHVATNTRDTHTTGKHHCC